MVEREFAEEEIKHYILLIFLSKLIRKELLHKFLFIGSEVRMQT